jgi:hypothetical protein
LSLTINVRSGREPGSASHRRTAALRS